MADEQTKTTQAYQQAFTICGTIDEFTELVIRNMDCPDTPHNRTHLKYALMHQRQLGGEERARFIEALNRGL